MIISGIYKITNLVNNKVYIGSSFDCYKRKHEHFTLSTKANPHLANAIKKYKIENFQFDIIDKIVFNKNCERYYKTEYLDCLEQYYMDIYECYNPTKGYNISKIAGRPTKITSEQAKKAVEVKRKKGFNKETYPLLSEAKLGNKNPMFGKKGKDSHSSKKVYLYDKKGIFFKSFDSLTEVGKFFNIKKVKTKRKLIGGFQFSLTYVDKMPIFIPTKRKKYKLKRNEQI